MKISVFCKVVFTRYQERRYTISLFIHKSRGTLQDSIQQKKIKWHITQQNARIVCDGCWYTQLKLELQKNN